MEWSLVTTARCLLVVQIIGWIIVALYHRRTSRQYEGYLQMHREAHEWNRQDRKTLISVDQAYEKGKIEGRRETEEKLLPAINSLTTKYSVGIKPLAKRKNKK